MNIGLWILQGVLALKFLSVVYTHGIRPDPEKMQRGRQRFGAAARPLLLFIALCAFLGAVGLILPAALGVLTWLTPLAAALLAIMMLLGLGFHTACREAPKIIVGLALLALAVFLAYGRWVLAPL